MIQRHLRLLGPVGVDPLSNPQSDLGKIPRFRSQRTVALLGYLVAEQRPIARGHLAGMFWPDEATSIGRGNLRRELHNLAKILPGCWELDHQAVAFVPSDDTVVDIYKLLQLEAEESWHDAVELLGGEFLEGLYLDGNSKFENWLLGEQERWRQRTEGILIHVIEGHTRRGHYAEALLYSRQLLQLTPWNEAIHRQVMRLLAWSGQRGAALRQFEICKQALREELGVEPSEETIALNKQIQAGSLDIPPQLPAFLTEEQARHEVQRLLLVAREDEIARLAEFLNAALDGQGRVIFITGDTGQGKTALMDAFAQQAMEVHPNLLVARGNCNAYSGVGDPYLPFRDVMEMLTGDVEAQWDAGAITRDHAQRLWTEFPGVVQALLDHAPHMVNAFVPSARLLSRAMAAEQGNSTWLPRLREQIKRQQTNSNEVEQSHLFQQFTNVLRSVAEEQPLLLLLDDFQWADAASIGLLFHLGRRLAEVDSRVLIACAYRPEEVALGRAGERHPLVKILSEFKRTFGDVWVDLDRADKVDGRKFVDAILDTEPNRLTEEFRAALFQRTEGHPLFTVELLRAMQERGDLQKDSDADGVWIEGPSLNWDLLPARVEAVIEERIGRLEPELQDTLTIASVEGEVFTAQVVAEVLNLPERLLLRWISQGLESRHRLVTEQEEMQTILGRMSRYRFGHVLFQEYLYGQLGEGERQMLHSEVAAALEKLYEGRGEEMAVHLAHHYHRANDYHRALHYYALAAEQAAKVFANDEAITHYTRAIEIADKISTDPVSLAKLHHGRGRRYDLVGDFDRARNDHKTSQRVAHACGERQVEWRALIDLGKLWASRDYHRSRGCFKEALELAQKMDDPILLGGSLNWMGNWYANNENPLKAIAYHQEALKIFDQLGDIQKLANTKDLLGIANLLRGDLTTSTKYYDQAIELFQELEDRPRLGSSLMGRATIVSLLVLLASVPAARSPDAVSDFERAIRIAREIGSPSGEAWANWSLGLLHTVQGDFGQALEVIQNGQRVASEIRHREWEVGNQFAIGVLYCEMLAPEQAEPHLNQALTLAKELRSQYWINHVIGGLATTYSLQNQLTKAQTCLESVISTETPMDTMGKRYCWARMAELALIQGAPDLALDITDRLIISAPGMSPGNVITFLWMLRGEALAVLGRGDEANPILRAAIENAHSTGEQFLLWRAHARLGHVYRAANLQSEAREEFSAANDLIEELAATITEKALKDNFLQSAYSMLNTSS